LDTAVFTLLLFAMITISVLKIYVIPPVDVITLPQLFVQLQIFVSVLHAIPLLVVNSLQLTVICTALALTIPAIPPVDVFTLLLNCNKCINPVNVTCPQINCENNVCNPATGTCQQTPINCNDNNACTTDGCDVNTGLCTHTLVNCTSDFCHHDGCDITTGCFHIPFNSTDCNDGSVCTIDSCNPAIGCVHTPIVCNDNNNCTTNNCSFLTGCFYPVLNCANIPRIAKFIGTCYEALCSNAEGGCYLSQLPGTTIDSCGVCNGNNECVIVPLPSNVPYVIGGALLAVIIIGSVIFGVALAAFGGKKGYDIWLKRRNNMSGASTNPLYNDNGLSGTNPMYSSRVTRM